jgi:anti-sigma factor RsiW
VTSLPIRWQRLVSPEGKTCDRCSATHQEMLRAIDKLKEALRPLDMAPVLEIKEVDSSTFKANPSESNRIWIAGKPMEEWLGASVGSSPCCSVCGTSECRTIEVGGATFETIPERLFLKAALLAASHVLSGNDGSASQ